MKAIPRFFVGQALSAIYGRFPRTVRLESTSHCNAKCMTCPHPVHERVQGIMSEALYQKILDECVAEGVTKLHLHNFGEPLIDKKLPRRIQLAKERGIRSVKIISNGSLLDEDRARGLIEAGLDEIKISFDGLSKEVFEKVRRGLSYDQVAANVEGLVRLRDSMGRTRPEIQLLFVSIVENEAEEAGFVDRWRGLVDRVDVTKAHNWGSSDKVRGGSAPPSHRRHDVREANLVPAAPLEEIAVSTDPKRPTGFPCLRLWQTFTILWDGRVALCCLDYDGREILGDLETQTVREIWEGARLREIRRWHLRGEFDRVPICSNCNAR